MMPLYKSFLVVVLMLSLSVTALAGNQSSLRDDLSAGDYKTAYVKAITLETSEGYALAAEALLSEIMLGQVEKNKKQAKRARKLAEDSLMMNPLNQNARLQYAIADGFVTRETGDVSAWMKKLPQKTLAILQTYREDFPDDPRGHAILGAWHLAIVRKTGGEDGNKWFGANITEGQELFLAAYKNQPQKLVIGVNYAFALIALKDKDLDTTDDARIILQDIARLTPQDHLSLTLQAYAREALTRLDDRDSAREYVGLFLDGKTPK